MIDIGCNVLVNMGDTGIQLWLFCCVTIICNFVCLKQQNRLSLILAQRMSKYQKIIDNREPRTIFKAPPIWNCRIELLQRSVARLRPLSLGQNVTFLDNVSFRPLAGVWLCQQRVQRLLALSFGRKWIMFWIEKRAGDWCSTQGLKMASKIIQTGSRQVKPILSLNSAEARRRVLTLYKAWYRQIPVIGMIYFTLIPALN